MPATASSPICACCSAPTASPEVLGPSAAAGRLGSLPAMRIGILGATGPAGRGLAARLASVGHEVLFGSREAAKAESGVAALVETWGDRVAGQIGRAHV